MTSRTKGTTTPTRGSHGRGTFTEDTELRWRRRPRRRGGATAARTATRIALDTTPMLLMKLSTMSRVFRPDRVPKSATETTVAGTPKTRAARAGDSPNLSCRPPETTCSRDSSEVTPARVNEAKKRTPKIAPPGIIEMIFGKVTKDRMGPETPCTSPTPTPCWCAMKPMAENTPMPARISKDELANPATRAVPVRLDLRLRYEA